MKKNVPLLASVLLLGGSVLLSSCHQEETEPTDVNLNQIYYTTVSGEKLSTEPSMEGHGAVFDFGDAKLVDHTYENGRGRLTFDKEVTTVGERAFHIVPELTSIVLPAGVKSIGTVAFGECENLERAELPNGIVKIGMAAFSYCDLKEVSLGSSITEIEDGAFGACENLQTVYCSAEQPPMLGEGVFDGIHAAGGNITIYVPEQCVEAYQNAENWKEYEGNIKGYDFGKR